MKTDDLLDAVEIPAGLESRLEKLIDRLAEEEKQSTRRIRLTRWWISGIAAGVALLLTIGITFRADYSKPAGWTAQAIPPSAEQEQAYREAEKALALVSRNFNKGMDQFSLAMSEIDKSNNTINKTLKR
ncbi:MAG: hypothetical protein LBC48_02565 [Dysgonamonadaceae bacterium]|jgi:hypothetical protein|nr:hypothetical protein [Dysgonamonadaceae bacterium]